MTDNESSYWVGGIVNGAIGMAILMSGHWIIAMVFVIAVGFAVRAATRQLQP